MNTPSINKRTKIVATIGPASNNKETITELAKAGANVLRLNFSHGSHEDHVKVIKYIHQVNTETELNLATLQDLQGPKIRVGMVKDNGVTIQDGQKLVISTEDLEGTSERVSTVYKEIVSDVKAGDTILIDDGNLELKTISVSKNEVVTEVVHGGVLKSRKGINLPDTVVSAPCLTEKDLEDLQFGLEQNVDWVALSFVRKPDDIRELRSIIEKAGKKTKIVAKIEKPEALKNIDEIIDESDGIMVARGDLGVEIAMHDVPLWQKKIVEKCNMAAKPVIIATQMMESMIENPRPTRAETNDVANAVMDGADALMLSAESAAGKFPVEAVLAMSETIMAVEAEANSIYNKYYDKQFESSTRMNDLLIRAACRLAENTSARALVCMTKSGYTGFRTAMHRSKSEVYLFTNNEKLLRQMNLVWGVKTFYFDTMDNIDITLEQIEQKLVATGHLKKDDIFINTASMPQHWQGHTNMMKIQVVE
ncbi:pyruvate kinase [Ekhidna lutea]|uniref:Pyruvate kinase n=1 Tax=Ekhidna lutea TaxID=447679 RepID=A0A239LXN3_EKHLU|nr:pyruvate kinase [Ekhidna lutea]SNT35427.1 pyruvate kinase [Ekhidna lutea]